MYASLSKAQNVELVLFQDHIPELAESQRRLHQSAPDFLESKPLFQCYPITKETEISPMSFHREDKEDNLYMCNCTVLTHPSEFLLMQATQSV
jgi:hypothetical protein